MGRKLLITDFRVPAPDQDSGSNSTLAYLRILSRAGYEITFVPQRLIAIRAIFLSSRDWI